MIPPDSYRGVLRVRPLERRERRLRVKYGVGGKRPRGLNMTQRKRQGRRLFLCLASVLFLILFLGTALAQQYVYVTDTVEITFRRGPGTEFKVMKVLKSGDRMKVVNEPEQQQGWRKVALEDGSTGYVLSRFITDQEPLSRKGQILVDDNQKLRTRVDSLTAENTRLGGLNTELTSKLTASADELKSVREELDQLKSDSKDVVKVRTEFQTLKKQNAELEERYRKAAVAGDEGEEKHLWVLLGAGVLVFGIVVGSISRRSSGSYAKLR